MSRNYELERREQLGENVIATGWWVFAAGGVALWIFVTALLWVKFDWIISMGFFVAMIVIVGISIIIVGGKIRESVENEKIIEKL